MKASGLALAILMGASSLALAQGRPYVPSMSCVQARRLVQSRGAIVLGTSPSQYDRYVSSEGYCQRDETAAPAFEPTRDQRSCQIGYYCTNRNDYFFR